MSSASRNKKCTGLSKCIEKIHRHRTLGENPVTCLLNFQKACAKDFPNLSTIILRIGFLRTSILIPCEPAEPNGVYP